jgi:hypothetical protein
MVAGAPLSGKALGHTGGPVNPNEIGSLEKLARAAVDLGAEVLEVESRDGHEEVVAYTGPSGRLLARLRGDTPEACALREDLYATRRRLLRFTVRGQEFGLRAEVYDSFGEDAFRVALRPLGRGGRQSEKSRPLVARSRDKKPG